MVVGKLPPAPTPTPSPATSTFIPVQAAPWGTGVAQGEPLTYGTGHPAARPAVPTTPLTLTPVIFANGGGKSKLTVHSLQAGTQIYLPVTLNLKGDADYNQVGQGGWQVVDRPKLAAALQWYDRSPWQLAFDVIIDKNPDLHHAYHESVEDYCTRLESWLDKVSGSYQPPVLIVNGPVPGVQRLWVLYTVDFQEAIRNAAGVRIQQNAKITLYEYVSPLASAQSAAYIYSPALKAIEMINVPGTSSTTSGTNAGGSQQWSTYTVTSADMAPGSGGIKGISMRIFKSLSYVPIILALNGLRDTNTLVVGQIIKLPQANPNG